MGMYQEALTCLKRVSVLKDSMELSQGYEQLNELKVKYDVDKLKYEKVQLENKNKRIIVICLSIILGIVVMVCA